MVIQITLQDLMLLMVCILVIAAGILLLPRRSVANHIPHIFSQQVELDE